MRDDNQEQQEQCRNNQLNGVLLEQITEIEDKNRSDSSGSSDDDDKDGNDNDDDGNNEDDFESNIPDGDDGLEVDEEVDKHVWDGRNGKLKEKLNM